MHTTTLGGLTVSAQGLGCMGMSEWSIVPIPGTKRVKWLEQNVAALDITLTAGELAILDPLGSQVAGSRY